MLVPIWIPGSKQTGLQTACHRAKARLQDDQLCPVIPSGAWNLASLLTQSTSSWLSSTAAEAIPAYVHPLCPA